MLLPTLIRRLNAETDHLWRVRKIQGNRQIQMRPHRHSANAWVHMAWADDLRDVARLVEDYQLERAA